RVPAGEGERTVRHPPADGPPGVENVRSLVLLVRHAGHSLLLTGDLEGDGLEQVLGLPGVPVDVMQAPHHGSAAAQPARLAAWARPRVVVACQGPPRAPSPLGGRVPYLSTWQDGAVTVVSRPDGLTGERLVGKGGLALPAPGGFCFGGRGRPPRAEQVFFAPPRSARGPYKKSRRDAEQPGGAVAVGGGQEAAVGAKPQPVARPRKPPH